MKPFLLAFDTATERMAVAVRGPGGTRLRTAHGGAQASAALLPLVELLMAEVDLRFKDVQAVAFGRGPGAFTGLRTACAAAQGLAFGIGCPVLAIDSLAMVADDARAQCQTLGDAHETAEAPEAVAPGDDVFVAMDARMEELYAGAWRWTEGGWLARRGPALYTLPALQALWRAEPPACVAGSALVAFGARLDPGAALRLDAELDRPAALLRLADAAWSRGETLDPADALPAYLRDKVALTTAERLAGRSAPVPEARTEPSGPGR